VQWLSDGIPDLRTVNPGVTTESGRGWFGIERRGAYRVTLGRQQGIAAALAGADAGARHYPLRLAARVDLNIASVARHGGEVRATFRS